MQYSSNLGANRVELFNGQNTATDNRQTELKDLSHFLRRLSQAMIYLEIINAGLNEKHFSGIQCNHGFFDTGLDVEETVLALFQAFFFCFNLADDDATCWDFADVQKLLVSASDEIRQLAKSVSSDGTSKI